MPTITRNIKIFVSEDDTDFRKECYKKLYDLRYAVRNVANLTSSHNFILDSSLPYLSDEGKENLSFLGAKGGKCTRGNAPYVAVSKEYKGKVSMRVLSNVIQSANKNYRAERVEMLKGQRSLRSYRSDIPIPFQKKDFRFEQREYLDGNEKKRKGVFFSLLGIEFQMAFGRDRSNNRLIVERVISGEYKLQTSSLQFKKKNNKEELYLLLCVNIPEVEIKLQEGKKMYAYLGVFNPIVCTTEEADLDNAYKVHEIGGIEEFNYRRRRIQSKLHDLQKDLKYAKGGKGRQKKLKALERFKKKESNYVTTKAHTYSRILVDLSVKHECSEIVLMKQKKREEEAKKEEFVLRNWGYFGLKDKIKYKAKMLNIKITEE